MTSRASTSKQQQHLPTSNVAAQIAAAAGGSSGPTASACCIQCRNVQSTFFCNVCLSERLILQHADYRRLREARQRARSRVEALLGLVDIPKSNDKQQKVLPDPFGEPERRGGGQRRKFTAPITAPHSGASIQDRIARATRFKLHSEIASNTKSTTRIFSEVEKGKSRLVDRRRDLDRRKVLLQQASEYLRHGGALDSDQDGDLVSDGKLADLRAKTDELQAEGEQVANEVAKARASLARQAFSLYDVCAPSSSLASARNSSSKPKSASPSSRTQRSKERYSAAGAFAIDFSSAFDLGKSFRESKIKEEVGNVNDWTILGLVLPLPSDLRRFDRVQINGAIGHIVQLLQLIITYLGITLPFVISVQGNLPQIRANPLWGAGAKETLHLSSSVHSALIAAGSTSVGALGASMMSSLGASTLSTIESSVQLPSAKNLPWAKNVVDPAVSKVDATGHTSGATEGGPPEDAATIEGKRFCYALTMLSYDVAYLASLQGVKVDLVMAAGSVLRLLSKAIQSPDLGKRSHSAHQTSFNIPNLQFATIDFAQLLQIHEPGSRQAAVGSASKLPPSSKAIMEGSYVDAKKAAESILDISQKDSRPAVAAAAAISRPAPSPVKTPAPAINSALPRNTTSTQTKEKLSSLAAKRVPSTLPLERIASGPSAKSAAPPISTGNTLDFLRLKGSQREQRSFSGSNGTKNTREDTSIDRGKERGTITSKAKRSVQVNASVPAANGTIIFNGKEIRGKTKNNASIKGDKAKPDDEGWHVL